MKIISSLQVACATALLAGMSPALRAAEPAAADSGRARADVIYLEREKFTDVQDRYLGDDAGRDEILDQLKEHITYDAAQRLPAGTVLQVTVTDIDLAGDFEPWHGPQFYDVRIVKDIYPPKIALAFKLTDAAGNVLKQGTRVLRDLTFQMSLSVDRDDPLHYEKQLIDDWFRAEFGRPKKA
jgi:hypothetical protein